MGQVLQVISEGAPAGLRVEFIKCRRALRFSGIADGARCGPVEVSVPPLLEQLDVERGLRVPARYLLFGGRNGKPRGGVGDLIGVFESESAARDAFVELRRRHSDDEGWGELVSLDGRGVLIPLGWFGRDGSSVRPMRSPRVGPIRNGRFGTAGRAWSRSVDGNRGPDRADSSGGVGATGGPASARASRLP